MQITDNIWIQDIHTTIEKMWVIAHYDIMRYNLLDKKYSHKDVFDIITHHVLLDLCSEILCCVQLGNKTILYLNTKFDLRSSQYIGFSQDTKKVVQRLEKLIPSIIPAYVIERPYPLYWDFITKYNNREAETVEEIEKIQEKFNKNAFKPCNLNKAIQYLDKRGLKYLSSDYFKQVNNKLLVINK